VDVAMMMTVPMTMVAAVMIMTLRGFVFVRMDGHSGPFYKLMCRDAAFMCLLVI
jgi:hypothetical protein